MKLAVIMIANLLIDYKLNEIKIDLDVSALPSEPKSEPLVPPE
jgi:hypothetical protein